MQTFTFGIKAVADMKDVQTSIQNIQNALKQLKLPNDLQSSFKKTFGDLEKELDKYQKLKAGGIKTKGDASTLEKSGNNIIRLYDDIVKKINSLDNSALKKAFEDIGAKEVENLKQQLDDLQTSLKTSIGNNIGSSFQNLKKSFKDLSAGAQDLDKELSKIGSSTLNTFINNLSSGRLDLAEKNFESLGKRITEVTTAINNQGGDTSGIINWLSQITEAFEKVKEDDSISSITQQMDQLKSSLATAKADALQGLIDGFKIGATNADDFLQKIRELISADKDWANEQANVNKELDQIKSRIQYFFGLNNAINLVKRAIRSAFNTIKELDKVMTETAVVTDYTVSDMWKRLPEYTQRANQLGVSTKAAYEAATLYYQQGLNTQQAGELSVETLKMARIAGLEAAEATDRMTNALRGFNMELDAVSAQRVDDVYSQLAAHTASNVDEISTAMTKVASLAHSANMEFETTAAFLSQIIETTRESAETAGTALKTVVARFSEVKKLYTESQISGTDEEGQIINVNKVGAALRTAGIDLNKYFLGEVGLDDIFIELASKWDSLTSVQQRYIATQAAGSRQQSRFIALMQDYARTQELVGLAYNATGASAKQFEKTQESLESKLARLKNAWNEFLMGLANSTVVKFAVDLLTNLLNVVNNLTSAFGNGIGSILKWAAALSAISGGKALLGGTLMNFLANAGIGNGEKGSTIAKLGKGIWKGLQNLGGTTSLASTGLESFGAAVGLTKAQAGGAAAGIMGIVTALGAVAAAATVAATAYALWLKNSAAGQYKQAQAYAKAMQGAADATQKQANSLKESQERYSELTQNVRKSSNNEEYKEAIQNRNDYIASLLQEDPSYYKYISRTKDKQGNFILTLDEGALASACNSIAQAAVETAANASIASGAAYMAQAAVYQKQASNAYIIAAETGNKKWQQDEITNAYIAEQNAQIAIEKGRSALEIGAKQKLDLANVSEDLVDTIASAFANSFDSEQYKDLLKEKLGYGIVRGENYWRAQYQSVFGEEAATGMSATEMRRAVASKQATDESYKIVDDITKLAQDENGKILLDIFNGSFEQLYDSEQISKFFHSFDDNPLQDTLYKIFDITKENYTRKIDQYANSIKKSQERYKQSVIVSLQKSGIKDITLLNKIANTTDMQRVRQIDELSKNLDGYNVQFKEAIVNAASNLLYEQRDLEGTDLEELINSVTENPVQTLEALTAVAKEAKGEVKDLFGQFGATTGIGANFANMQTALGFSNADLVQYYLLSDEFQQLDTELNKLIEDNGQINSKNIEDLAKSSKTLDTLLNKNIVSAEGLAKAVTGIQKGDIAVSDLNERVLETISSFDTLGDSISRAKKLMDEFDAGDDEGEAIDFVSNQLKELQEQVDKVRLGATKTKNLWELFFGSPPPESAKEFQNGIDLITKLITDEGAGFWEALGFQRDKNGNVPNIGASEYAEKLADGTVNSYKDYLKEKAKGTALQDLSDDFYDLMISNMKAHDIGGFEEIAAIDVQNLVKAYGAEQPSKEDILAIAGLYGLDPQAVLNEWAQQFREGETILLESLAKSNKEIITSLASLESTAQYQGGTSNIFKAFGIDENGVFSLDTLYLKIGELVPEVADGTFTAEEWVEKYFETKGPVEVPVTYTYLAKDDEDNYSIENETVYVTVENLDEYKAAAQQIQDAADTNLIGLNLADASSSAQAIADFLTDLGGKSNITEISGGITTAKEEAGKLKSLLEEEVQKHINIIPNQSHISISGEGGSISFSISAAAKGGIVSAANGTIKPGLALTGEETPEIVWNKEKGYAYLAGKNGPEINNLQPGDQVFNGQQTKEILKRSGLKSFAKGTIPSYGNGLAFPTNGKGGGSGSGADKAKEDKWKNEIDWLYNLVEDIAELERIQTQLAEKYEDYLNDDTKTGKDLYNLLVQQLGNLYTQLNHQTYALEKREQEMREFMDTTNKYDDYLSYNWNDRTLEIDWDRIEALGETDKETYEEIKDLISQAESIQDNMDEAQDAIIDIQNQIEDLENIWRDTFVDFEKRVLDAIIKQYQKIIDDFSDLNNTLNDSNSSILESLQQQINLQRQTRDNTKTEQEIADAEARLAYLRRDTTGGNELAALELEKQLADQRENYEDTLVDQAIARLQQDNSEAAEQRARQIELMQAQLDYQVQNGDFNNRVLEIMNNAISSDGTLLTNSELVKLLQQTDNWDALSEANRKIWEEELNNNFKQAVAYLLKDQAQNTTVSIDNNGNAITKFIEDVNKNVQAIGAKIGAKSQAATKNNTESGKSSGGGGSSGGSGGSGGSKGGSDNHYYQILSGNKPVDSTKYVTKEAAEQQLKNTKDWAYTARQKAVGDFSLAKKQHLDLADPEKYAALEKAAENAKNVYNYWASAYVKKYKTGGLVNSTGPAWLDGTKSAPEYVLNARQTEAFLRLAEVLPNIISKSSSTSINQNPTNIELNIEMKVDKISSDYDVDKIADRVKNIIYNVGSYRNVNTLSLKR